MRFLSVSTPGSLSITVGTQGELHGFTAQLFEDHPANLHVRSVKLGPATIVVIKVGELDAILTAASAGAGTTGGSSATGAAQSASGTGGASTTSSAPSGSSTLSASQRNRRGGNYDTRAPHNVWRRAINVALSAISAERKGFDGRLAESNPVDDAHDEDEEEEQQLQQERQQGRAQNMFIVVGSDEGYTEVTLLRVACLLSELCAFLCIEPYGGPNAAVLKQVMMYIEQRLGLSDVSFLTEAIEHLMKPAIIATGFTANPTALLDDLVRQNLFAPHTSSNDPLGKQGGAYYYFPAPQTAGGGASATNRPGAAARGMDEVENLRSASMGPLDEERVPGYATVMFGHKMVLETSSQISDEAMKINGMSERFTMSEADRYLIHLITTAHFAMPLPQSYHDVASTCEKRIRLLEYRLRRFGIHRHNVTRHACRKLIESYCKMLRRVPTDSDDSGAEEDVCDEAHSEHAAQYSRSEDERADFFEDAFNELLCTMSNFPERVSVIDSASLAEDYQKKIKRNKMKSHDIQQDGAGATSLSISIPGDEDTSYIQHRDATSGGGVKALPLSADGELFYTNNRATYFPSMAGKTVTRNQYHDLSVRFEELEDSVFSLHNLCFRNADFTGSMQLVWIPTVDSEHLVSTDPDDSHDDGDENGDQNGSPDRERTRRVPKRTADSITDICPHGYGMALVYLPPTTDRDADRLPPRMTREEIVYNNLAQEVLGSMEVSFNCFQWLLSPPVESYETAGLIHFVVIDRMRGNRCIAGSLYRMMHQKPIEVQYAVLELRRTFAECVSRAHELLSMGYSEGLWGHLGMQFFYSVGMFSASAANILASSVSAQGNLSAAGSRDKRNSSTNANRAQNTLPSQSGASLSRVTPSQSPLMSQGGVTDWFSPASSQPTSATQRVRGFFQMSQAAEQQSRLSDVDASDIGSTTDILASSKPGVLTSAEVSFVGPGNSTQQQHMQTAQPAGQSIPSLYGPLDKKKIPSAAIRNLVLRPTSLPDTISEKAEKSRIVEVYAMFIGSMSPEEVCWNVQQLLVSKVF